MRGIHIKAAFLIPIFFLFSGRAFEEVLYKDQLPRYTYTHTDTRTDTDTTSGIHIEHPHMQTPN